MDFYLPKLAPIVLCCLEPTANPETHALAVRIDHLRQMVPAIGGQNHVLS
eukprot:COSAG02_NODE_16276_length_1097_cov_0.976954_3_plen_49_part_01